MEFSVVQPAAWIFAPVQTTDMVGDPDLSDTTPRWDHPVEGGWEVIIRTVNGVIAQAQAELADLFAENTVVEYPLGDELNDAQRFIAQEWLFADQPEFSPAEGTVTNGRHRTWEAKNAGCPAAPVLTSDLSDAIRFWTAEPDEYWLPNQQSLNQWRQNLAWWKSEPARSWRELNPRHQEFMAEAITRWTERVR